MSLIEYQRIILADDVRNRAFEQALQKVIKPGMTVVDIGAGTGYLSFLARKLGAKECYLYEVSELSELSHKIAKQSGITGCHCVHKHSTEVKNPPKADVVVSETLGNFALEESIIGNLNDAKRFLKPGGVLIPGVLRQYIAPVVTDRIQQTIDTWKNIGADVDWSPARDIGLNNMYVKDVEPGDLLPDGMREWDTIDFRKNNKEVRSKKVEWKWERLFSGAGPQARMPAPQFVIIHGFALWWEAELIPGVTLSTSPFAPPTHWQQIYLPLTSPISPDANDTIELHLHVDSRYDVRINVAWKTVHKDSKGKILQTQSQDMRKGFLS